MYRIIALVLIILNIPLENIKVNFQLKDYLNK